MENQPAVQSLERAFRLIELLSGTDKKYAAAALKKLEKGGYIRRMINQEDNRYNRVEITQKGEQVIEESIQIFNELDQQMLGGLTEEELNVLNGYLLRIKQTGK